MSAELIAKYPDVDPFLLKKWEKMFKNFFDTNAGGTMDWGDFYLVTKVSPEPGEQAGIARVLQKVKQIYGAESEQMAMAHNSLKALWAGLLKAADANQDQIISVSEWIELIKGHDPSNEAKWFGDYMTFVFKLFDVSQDNEIDVAEYVDGMSTYGFVEGDAKAAFNKFAAGTPKNTVNFMVFKKLWNEYFYSKDPAAPGNNLFGIIQ